MSDNKSNKFLKLVKKHKEKKGRDKFKGTLENYLKLIEKDKSIPKLAHKRLYDSMIKEFNLITKIPALLNTSFNLAGEPLIETPKQAIN